MCDLTSCVHVYLAAGMRDAGVDQEDEERLARLRRLGYTARRLLAAALIGLGTRLAPAAQPPLAEQQPDTSAAS